MDQKHKWNEEKNKALQESRGVTFEQIVIHIQKGDLLAIKDHPNQVRYPGQQLYFVLIDDYVYLVPFIEKDDHIFLKTIIPSRKATRQYIGKR